MHKKRVVEYYRLVWAIMIAFGAIPAVAQSTGNEVIELPAFTVSSKGDTGYYAANALSGTRTNIRLRDLPQSIQVITGEFMSDIGAIKLEDALRYTTSVSPTSEVEGRFSVRGFNVNEPKRNGINTSFYSHWDSATIDRLEVVKGPSSPLYGISRPGGFINVITKKPTTTAQHSVKLIGGSWSNYRAEIDFSGPITEDKKTGSGIYYRLIGVQADKGSFLDFADEQRSVLAPSLTWKVTPKTEITLELYALRSDKVHDYPVLPVLNNNRELADVPRGYNVNGPDSFSKYDDDLAMLYFTHRFNDTYSLRSVASYIHTEQKFLRRQGFVERAPAGSGLLNNFGLYRTYRNEDTGVQTDLIADFVGRIFNSKILVGHSWSHTRREQTNFSNNNETPFPFRNPTAANYQYKPISTFQINQGEISVGDQNALYAVADANFWNNRFRLFAGWRANWNENKVINWRLGTTSPKEKSDTNAPQIGGMFNLNDSIGFYGFYSESIEVNGLISGVRAAPLLGKGLEFGSKFSFLGGRVSGSVATFDITFENLIVGDFSVAPPAFSLSGVQASKGYEGEIYFTPNKNVSLIAGYSYNDAYTKSDRQRPQLVGQPLADTPKHAANFWVRYNFTEGPLTGASIGFGTIYRSDWRPFGIDAARYLVISPGYTIFNASASYTWKLANHRQIALQLNLENLTDKHYRAKGNNWGAPFNSVLSAKYSF